MFQIKNVVKNYMVTKELTVQALKGVSLNFRRNEFVAVLGPSGCGKTTLLNIIGGLDRYTDGDLIINGKSTKGFSDSDWDSYRNRSIGFVFQSYNLIPNMTVLDNVILSLSVAGESRSVRAKKAKAALERVGLSNHLKKYPNQLSGGQMQRVAIARAIVNDPDVILADEPTGALDSETGIRIMELLKEISGERLVIMVTHNLELAEAYATRTVKLFDGELISDSNPYADAEIQRNVVLNNVNSDVAIPENTEGKKSPKKSHMSVLTAFMMSLKNIKVKLGRTLLTSFAGSIGIFGIALVLAISAGMGNYVDYMQTEAVGDSAVRIGETAYSLSRILSVMEEAGGANNAAYPNIDAAIPYQRESFSVKSTLSDGFIEYIKQLEDSSWVKAINYTYSVQMRVLQKNGANYTLRSNWSSYANQMIEEDELIEENYDVLYKSENSETGYPKDYTEVSFVVDKYNRISPGTLSAIGIPYTRNNDGSYNKVPFSDIVDKEYEIVLNDGWYLPQTDGTFKAITGNYGSISGENKVKIKIVSVLRVKNNNSTLWLESGLAYLPELSEFLVDSARKSAVGQAQLEAKDTNVLTGNKFSRPSFGSEEDKDANVNSQYIAALKNLGAYTVPTNVQIYPKDIDSKKNITNYIEEWNSNPAHKGEEVAYLDLTDLALSMLSKFIDIVAIVLIAFSAVALVVSTVMISVITYTSVVERVKVIGVLRSIGARKGDIASLFNTETLLIGTFAGVIGVGFAALVGILINSILGKLIGVASLVQFSWLIIVGMFALSIGLTFIAGVVPAIIAAKKDPVTCLRSE